jgi:DNA-binding CsgD family transcriptional regulator
MLAEGRTNAQIAEELFVSTKTVARHLESIYRKLGVNHRGAAIAWVLRNRERG